MLTFDLDFGDILAASRGNAPSVIIFRLRNQAPASVNPRLFRVIDGREEDLTVGAVRGSGIGQVRRALCRYLKSRRCLGGLRYNWSMQQRTLGHLGPSVSALGLGCMSIGIAEVYTSSVQDDDAAVSLIHRALDLGITLLDTADIYGVSEIQVGKALKGRRQDAVLATKFGFTVTARPGVERTVNGSPDYVSKACDTSLEIADRVRRLASEKGCTPAQLALAWRLSKPDVIPIPGTSSAARLEENVRAADVRLTASDLAQIERELPEGPATGPRYDAAMLELVDQ